MGLFTKELMGISTPVSNIFLFKAAISYCPLRAVPDIHDQEGLKQHQSSIEYVQLKPRDEYTLLDLI